MIQRNAYLILVNTLKCTVRGRWNKVSLDEDWEEDDDKDEEDEDEEW